MTIDYGTDLECLEDLSEECRVTSDPRVILAQALIRRWTTPRGTLLGSPDYGTDLAETLNAEVDNRELARVKAEMLAEARKDERVTAATILESSYNATTRVLNIRISIEANDLVLTLKVAVSDVTVSLLSLE